MPTGIAISFHDLRDNKHLVPITSDRRIGRKIAYAFGIKIPQEKGDFITDKVLRYLIREHSNKLSRKIMILLARKAMHVKDSCKCITRWFSILVYREVHLKRRSKKLRKRLTHAKKSHDEKSEELGENEFYVERILEQQKQDNDFYLVKWKNYSTIHNQWVHVNDIESSLIDDFHARVAQTIV